MTDKFEQFNKLLDNYLEHKSAAERLELLQAFNRATNKGQAVATEFTKEVILSPKTLKDRIRGLQEKRSSLI